MDILFQEINKMIKYTVEAIEGTIAVLLPRDNENDKVVVPSDQLPPGIKDGDIIEAAISAEGIVTEYKPLTMESKEAINRNQALLDRLRNK
jgi:hypothetical protein